MSMQEIKIYLDREKTQQVEDEVIFDPVIAGEVVTQSIFIENVIDYPLGVKLSLEGDDIEITKDVLSIQPGILEEVEFGFTPKLTALLPIKAKLNIKLNYVVS